MIRPHRSAPDPHRLGAHGHQQRPLAHTIGFVTVILLAGLCLCGGGTILTSALYLATLRP